MHFIFIYSKLYLFKALFIQSFIYSKLYLFKALFIQSFIYSKLYLFKAFYSTPPSNHFQTAFIHFFQIPKTLSKL